MTIESKRLDEERREPIKKPRRANCALGICGHVGCEMDRRTVVQPCAHCGEPIGFNAAWVVSKYGNADDFEPDELKHAACVLPEGSVFA